jgi:hypothetical protein
LHVTKYQSALVTWQPAKFVQRSISAQDDVPFWGQIFWAFFCRSNPAPEGASVHGAVPTLAMTEELPPRSSSA